MAVRAALRLASLPAARTAFALSAGAAALGSRSASSGGADGEKEPKCRPIVCA